MVDLTGTTSVMDKTDWRKTIHKCLEECVMATDNPDEYFKKVEAAISAIAITYPNWNAYVDVTKNVDEINKKHNAIADEWIENNKIYYAQPWIREWKRIDWKMAMYREIETYLKNMVGEKRMLLYGTKKTYGGSGQMTKLEADE